MVDIINFLLLAALAICLVRLIFWVSKRCLVIVKLMTLKRECGAKIKFLRFPFLPNACISKNPDISVEIRDTVYLIRLYSGGTRYSVVHFASEKFSVRSMKMASRFVARGRGRASVVDASQAFSIGARVFLTPTMKIPDIPEYRGKRVEKIMLFNPAPNTVSYVTPEKTTIKLAFTGDELFDMKIFTASSFAAYADRETRRNDEFRYFT